MGLEAVCICASARLISILRRAEGAVISIGRDKRKPFDVLD
jgi:hypothetical protein